MAVPSTALEQTQPLRKLRLIIVDDSREYMGILRRMLAATLPDVEVTEYDAEQKGKPSADFNWSMFDALLLDHNLGDGPTGLDWLKEFRGRTGFPPTILMTTDGDEYLAARAIKLGAFDYVRKKDITTERVGRLISEAVTASSHADGSDVTLKEDRESPHRAILERLARRVDERRASTPPAVAYRFVRLIGQGANSRVYLAERTSDDNTLVLKIVDADTIQDIQLVERFIREAEIVATLSNPCVVRFFDYGLTATYGYIAMEFFTRGDLKQRLERGVSVDDALNYLRHIALGLEVIHSAGVIHRDLKPGNIMFRADDSLALADFGISKRTDQTSDLTNQGCVLGTPNYLSPEQALGHDADQRSDLYSAGIVLYEMLVGCKPFRANNPAALIYQHVHAPVPELPDEIRDLQPLVDRLLAKSPDQRFTCAAELVTAVEAVCSVRDIET